MNTKLSLVSGGCLLLSSLAVSAFSGFESAPQAAPDSSYRMPRTVKGAHASSRFSDQPFKGSNLKSAKAGANGPLIYGMMLYSDAWYNLDEDASFPYGCYEIQKGRTKPRAMFTHPNLMINGGGCYTDRQVHVRMYELLGEAPYLNNYYQVINTDDWVYVQDPILTNEQASVANDMTYDPISKKIYAAVWGNFDGGNTKLATINPTSGVPTEIATIPDMACLVANNFGELYGVELLTGMTYQFNKTTGEATPIGYTGLTPKYMQSACIDPETNVIYWLATLEDETSGIYTINTSTGKADLYYDLPDNDEFTCAFIEAATKGLNAPAALADFSVNATAGGSKVKFTAPSKAFDGSAAGQLTVKVYADGREVYSKEVANGASDEFTVELGDGYHSVIGYAQNSVGEGPKSAVYHFTGNDAPAAPSNIHLDVVNNVATLTWDAPEYGLHGGTIEADKLSYNIVRYPGAEEVATEYKGNSFTETLPDVMANYYYKVTSVIGENIGGSGNSNSWFAGAAFTVPYTETFDTPESFNGFTCLDGDGDEESWTYSDFWKAAWSKYNKYEQSDNWLITPPIMFDANSTYQLSFLAKAFDEEYAERFEVLIGKAPTMEAMTQVIVPATITNDEKYQRYSGSFTTDASGILYIGFHAISPANSYRLLVDDIEVKLTNASGVPAAVSDLTATPAADGSNSVALTFTAPSKTQDGSILSSLESIQVYRGTSSTPVKTFTNPAPGSKLEWTDDTAPSGEVTYRVLGVNDAGNGIEASVTTFVGFDTPLPATNLKLTLDDEGNLNLTWKAPTTTVTGQPINPAYLHYDIWRNDGFKMVENYTSTSFTDPTLAGIEEQAMAYYQVDTYYGDKMGDVAIADYVIVGPSMSLPFKESFAEKSLENRPWVISRLTGHTDMRWTLQSQAATPSATSQDNDGGFASFVSYDQAAGIKERMTSPKIDLFSANHPVLKFWIYKIDGDAKETLEVQISNNDQQFTTLAAIPTKGSKSGWEEVTVEIPRKYCTESAMISFLGTTARGFNIHIDNIRIENGTSDLYEYDLEAVSLNVPDLFPDQTAELTLMVYNNGAMSIDKYSVALLVNGQQVITSNNDTPIASGETYNYIFKLTPEQADLNETFRFKGRVTCDVDVNQANNETEEVVVTVGVSGLSEIGIEADSLTTVFTLDGVVLLRDVPASELSTLPSGLYIIRSAGKTVKLRI